MINEKIITLSNFQSENAIIKNPDQFIDKSNYTQAQIKSMKSISNKDKEDIEMSDFITRKEFEQFEKRIDANLQNINDKLDKLPGQIEDKINLSNEKMKNTQMKWFIGIILTLIGLAGRIFGIY